MPDTPRADAENRAIALAVALCDARADVSGSRGQRTGAGLVCVLPRGHEEGLHYDSCDRIWWAAVSEDAGELAEAEARRG